MAKGTDRGQEADTEGTAPVRAGEKRKKTADEILALEDTTYSEIYVPEWDADFIVRSLTVGERDRWERLATGNLQDDDKKLFGGVKLNSNHTRAAVVQMCTLDPDTRTRFFPNPQHVLQIARKSSSAVTRLFDEIIKISKVDKDDLTELEASMAADPTSRSSTPSRGTFGSGT